MGNTTLKTAVALLVMAGAAGAQDVNRWDGAYSGGSLGYAWGGDDRVGLSIGGSQPRTVGTLEDTGPTISLHGGYRWQTGSSGLVLGGQMGVMLGNTGDDLRVSNSGGDITIEQRMDYAFTARAIAGKALANDTLLYGSAGLIYGAFNLSARNNLTGEKQGTDFDRTGYTLGLGIEKALSGDMSVYGEYEYANFGKEVVVIDGASTRATPKWDSIRVGFNYRF